MIASLQTRLNTPTPPGQWPVAALPLSAAVLGGCASFSPDGGFAAVEKTAKESLGKDLLWSRTEANQPCR